MFNIRTLISFSSLKVVKRWGPQLGARSVLHNERDVCVFVFFRMNHQESVLFICLMIDPFIGRPARSIVLGS